MSTTPWGKYFSKSKAKWYYHNKVSKATFWTEDGLPYGWAFIWEGNAKKYFNVITNQTVNEKSNIPGLNQAAHGGQQKQTTTTSRRPPTSDVTQQPKLLNLLTKMAQHLKKKFLN